MLLVVAELRQPLLGGLRVRLRLLGALRIDLGLQEAPRVLASLRDYIVAHLSERVLVTDLAREAVLSPHRFARAFSEHMRQSPHQFVLGLRLDRAAQLLRSSNLNLVEVALDCGFANQQHLCNAMRRHLGTTPNRYRRTHKKGTEIES